MNKILDLSSCEINERNGTYGGFAGDKEGIVFEGENWIIKYPKSTRGMRGNLVSYTTAPLSEYIGSHIYSILGYDVHETRLGIRNNKLVVACKDFCDKEGALREIQTLKNIYDEELARQIDRNIGSISSSHIVDLNELMVQLRYNPVLSAVPGLEERFWDCVIVDVLINNNDRNNGNWGLLYENGEYKIAPIYDNGAAFSNKYTDEKIRDIMRDAERMRISSLKISTAYGVEDIVISAEKILRVNNSVLSNSLKKNVPLIKEKMPLIKEFIDNIPEKHGEITVCSTERKQFYMKGMELRMDELIEPALELHQSKQLSAGMRLEESLLEL